MLHASFMLAGMCSLPLRVSSSGTCHARYHVKGLLILWREGKKSDGVRKKDGLISGPRNSEALPFTGIGVSVSTTLQSNRWNQKKLWISLLPWYHSMFWTQNVVLPQWQEAEKLNWITGRAKPNCDTLLEITLNGA